MQFKSLVIKFLVSSSLLMFLGGCTDYDLSQNAHNINDLIEYKGVKVKNRFLENPEVLSYSEDEYQKLYNKEIAAINITPNSRLNNGEVFYPSLEDLAKIERKNMDKFPNVYEMDEETLVKVKQDFPTMSDEEIAENIEIIAEYYEKCLQYYSFKGILDFFSKKTNQNSSENSTARYGDDYYGGACSEEFWYLFGRPTAADAVWKAKDKAHEFTNQYYGKSNPWLTKADAFRHAVWNALIVKYYGYKKMNVGKGVDLARDFTNIHESCGTGEDWDNAMDYHNNFVGRDFMSKHSYIRTSGWWKFVTKTFVSPSEQSIKENMKYKADNALKADRSVSSVNSKNKYHLVYID